MSGSKHAKARGGSPFRSDLDRNPGIGQSKGTFATGADIEEIEGENTVEGDIENDPSPSGAVPERKLGRTNK
jgi:hypothetical protein